MFFCKDCDGYRVQGKSVAIYGWTNETIDYALAMLAYTPVVTVVTNGRKPGWDRRREAWISEYDLPVFGAPILRAEHEGCQIRALVLDTGEKIETDASFTTRG